MSTDKVDLPVDDLFGLLYWPALPATLVTSLDPDGQPHVAPFSLVFFPSYTNVESIAPSDKIVILGIGEYESLEATKTKRTYRNIVDGGEFVVNIPSADIVRQANRTVFPTKDKFAASGLTPLPSLKVKPPAIAECKASFECEVFRVDDLRLMAELIWGKVVAARVDRELHETPTERKMALMNPIYHYAYSHDNGTWYGLGDRLLEEVE
jgi:flavin reductase (DIM6/NTAB) family NADH-FMN oxidoreductase RutF